MNQATSLTVKLGTLRIALALGVRTYRVRTDGALVRRLRALATETAARRSLVPSIGALVCSVGGIGAVSVALATLAGCL